MIEAIALFTFLIQYPLNAGKFFYLRLYPGDVRLILDINVGDLVVCNGEGLRGARIEKFQPLLFPYGEQSRFSQCPVDVYGV